MAAAPLSRPVSQKALFTILAFILVSLILFTHRLSSPYMPAAYLPFGASSPELSSGTPAKGSETESSASPVSPDASETPAQQNQQQPTHTLSETESSAVKTPVQQTETPTHFESIPELEVAFNRSRHGPWEAPKDLDPQIHGQKLSTIERPKPAYPLDPFVTRPMEAPATDKNAPWLAAVMCSPWDTRRRMMIRASWMRLYQDVPFDPRFVIANPGPNWAEAIRLENSTYGDMIVLDTIPEDDITANTVKTLVFFRWLTENSPKKYAYVTKMDIDLWLNARRFWDKYLVPRLSDGEATVTRTMFGQLYYYPVHEMVFPHGAMYTVTWDMLDLLATLQEKHNVTCGEDMANTILLLKGKEKVTLINFKGSEKFDYDDRDTRPGENTAWAPSTTDPTAPRHALYGPDVMAVHQLKSDGLWFKVAVCFDEQGIKSAPPERVQPPPEDVKPPPPENVKPPPSEDAKSPPPEDVKPPPPGNDKPPPSEDAKSPPPEDVKPPPPEDAKPPPPEDSKPPPPEDAQPPPSEKVESRRIEARMRYQASQFRAIPDRYWDYDDATWSCNGVWELERGVDRNPDI